MYNTPPVEEKSWHFTDKTGWPQGRWLEEPDKIQWRDDGAGLPCLIVRGPSGALCGYVGVPESHPYFGKDYGQCLDLKCDHEDWCHQRIDSEIGAHGGITFSGACSESEHGICHVIEGDDKTWWFGFDCAHSGDLCPPRDRYAGDWYKDVDYVKSEIQSLALQLARIKHEKVA